MSVTVKWNQAAIRQLENLIDYIGKDSELNALKIETVILSRIAQLVKNPEIYHLDKYKINNDGSFRAFEIYSYRIAYRFKNRVIRVIRIRHTKMNPLKY